MAEIIVPGCYAACANCPEALEKGTAALAGLPDGASNDMEILCEHKGSGLVEMTAKPKGQLVVNGEKTGTFGGVVFRGSVACPGQQG